jgi:ribosome maturation factor RimP
MDLSGKIKDLADQHLAGTSHFVLNVKLIEKLNPPRITVVVDGEEGITIDDCARLSRALGDSISQAALLDDFSLEVTTPGIDQSLKLLRQFKKHVGRTLKIELKENETVRGKLIDLEGDLIVLEEETKTKGKKSEKNIRKINFELIDKTFVMVSFK